MCTFLTLWIRSQEPRKVQRETPGNRIVHEPSNAHDQSTTSAAAPSENTPFITYNMLFTGWNWSNIFNLIFDLKGLPSCSFFALSPEPLLDCDELRLQKEKSHERAESQRKQTNSVMSELCSGVNVTSNLSWIWLRGGDKKFEIDTSVSSTLETIVT